MTAQTAPLTPITRGRARRRNIADQDQDPETEEKIRREAGVGHETRDQVRAAEEEAEVDPEAETGEKAETGKDHLNKGNDLTQDPDLNHEASLM